ncbi:MAG: AAA domain-containing protein [Bacteroidota bacterium]
MLTHEHIRAYQRRLTDLSQRNRALKHLRLSARRDFDLESFSYIEGKSVDELLWSALRGHKTPLIRQVSERAEQTNRLDARLRKIHRTLQLAEAETGLYDFYLAYPFIEGKFADGSICRAPLMLLPMELVRKDGRPRWSLHPRDSQQSVWNPVFLRAYERYTDTRIPEGFWTADPIAESNDLQQLLNRLYALIRDFDLRLDFQSETHRQHVKPYRELLTSTAEQFQQGVLKLQPYAVLGVFPQSDATLLQDYETLLDSEHLPALNSTPPQPVDLDQLPEDEYLCLPTDDSQLRAHRALRTGASISVQGPPGTGKSQWIVNVVADYLMRNKRVLVVSQKRAALEVVYERLSQLNFGPFAYLIHDFRNDRAGVYGKLARFLEALPELERRHASFDIQRAKAAYQTLNEQINEQLTAMGEYGQAAARPQACGLNVLELYQRVDTQLPEITIPFDVRALRASDLPELRVQLQELWAYADVLQPSHPWAARRRLSSFNSQERQEWLRLVDTLPEICSQLHQAQAIMTTSDGRFLPHLSDFEAQLERLFELLTSLQTRHELREALELWLQDPRTEVYDEQAERFQELTRQIERFGLVALSDIGQVDHLLESLQYYMQKQGQLTARMDAEYRSAKRELKAFTKAKALDWKAVNLAKLKQELATLSRFKALSKDRSTLLIFSSLYHLESAVSIKRSLRSADEATQLAQQLQQYASWSLPALRLRPDNTLTNAINDALKGARFIQNKLRVWAERLVKIEQLFGSALKREILESLDSSKACGTLAQKLQSTAKTDFDRLLAADELLAGLHPEARQIFECCLQPRLPLDFQDAWQQTEQALFRNWLAQAEAAHPNLMQPANPHYQQRIALLQTRWQRRMALAQELVLHTLQTQAIGRQSYNRLGNPVTYREIRHQVNKRRQIWPLRQLIEQAWDSGLDHLMPCVLASPETVSAIFPMQAGLFDLVVFDEASQCAVERALPAMLRGTQTAVVGDHQQLQPLQLFQAELNTTPSMDLQSAVWEESESLLDLARQRFPEFMLQWHYRSRVPELIAFSNQRFYHSALRALPSPHPKAELQPFGYHHLSGRWHSGMNELEAHEIVARTLHYLREPEAYSVGIVTFNQQQQDLILELLEAHIPRLHDAGETPLADFIERSLRGGVSTLKQELLLVRNIENVQGNERDIILFSVGYGPDASGKLSVNFGLLNRMHGENRLNVAITRARRRVEVFASFKPWELKVEDTKHEGPKLLKRWLQKVWNASEDQQFEQHSTLPQLTGTASEVARLLAPHKLRLRAFPFDGHSPLYGIYQSDQPQRFLGGLIIETPQWYDTPSVLARLVFQPQQLEGREWQIHYLWARAFWQMPEQSIQKLIEQLKL